MVEKIKCIRSELEFEPLSDRKRPGKRKIDLSQTETWYVVAALRSLPHRIRKREGVCVERFAAGCIRISKPERLIRNKVGPRESVPSRSIVEDHAVKRKSRARDDDRFQRPVSARDRKPGALSDRWNVDRKGRREA